MVGLTGSVSAELDFNIRQSCQSAEEPVFSMYSKEGGNIGMPGFYKWQVCGSGIEHAEIRDSCNQGENSIISMFEKNDSHASIDQSYRWDVCIPQVKTNLSQSCENPVASMKSETDSHIAEPGHYTKNLCASFDQPENVSVQLELDAEEAYIDGSEAEERTYNTLELSYPYIVSGQPAGIVDYGELIQIEYANNSGDTFRVTQTTEAASVLLPFTTGGHTEVEDEESEVVDRIFLNGASPSFGFAEIDEPTVKVRRKFENSVTGFEGVKRNNIELSIRNKINDNSSVEIVISSIG